ncbi:YD repeat-containing protein [Beauveria brongniartii RCEF 3172]|uniref:YD repeat-containing protein n=1 Tax=Beauveria brongniartii RCEF 3172 TaxID=1081107 RepID=A0A167EKQ5_9HYPO|nr:YD repeat-containing protein [Beauveria brongniartii RCEF 3172]
MSNPSPIYSQGFNFGSFIQKGVDPRTGQYTCTIDIYETPSEVRNCSPFKLSLTFNPLITQNIGLGQGWSFTLPCYHHRQAKTVELSTGESYRVTETSSNIFAIDQKLKSSQLKKLGSGDYQVTYKSGQVEILSNANNSYNKSVLVELYSHIGRRLSFSWVRSGNQPRLEKILQGSEVLLKINYGASQVDITRSPNTSEACTFTLIQRNNQLTEFRLPLVGAPSWKFVYENFGQMGHLKRVTNPSGFIEEVQYKEQGHGLPTGAPFQSIPYVISHTAHPGVGQPPIRTRYDYSDRNFLAYGGSHSWKDGEDNLYLTPHDYQYSSTARIEGGTTTKHTYNKFHLLVSSEQQKGTKQVIQATTYHALPSSGFEAQPAQFQLPKTVETTYRDTTSAATRKETSHYVFDEWGNPMQDIQPNGVKTDRTYYAPDGENGSGGTVNCPPDPHGFQRYIKTETVTPAAGAHSAPTRVESYTYSQIPIATAGNTAYFVAVQKRQALEASRVLTVSDYTYVNRPATKDHGRLQQEVTRLLDQKLTTKNWTYTYPGSNRLVQALSTKSFDNSTVEQETSYSLLSGLTLTYKDEAGVSDHFSYDIIGRLVKTITSPGTPYQAVLQHEYNILQGSKGYRKTVTDAKGVKTRYTTDGLERLCQVDKQDADGTFRVTEEHSYNAQGQRDATVEIDWLRSKGGKAPVEQRSRKSMEYDDWGNIYKITERTGLTTLSITDPITQKKIQGIEGEGTVKTLLNIFGAPTETALHKRDNTLYSKVTYSYDGLGRLINQRDHLGRTKEYRRDSFDRINETIWPNDRVVKTEYAGHTTAALPASMELGGIRMGEQSFDGLSRLRSKAVGRRTTQQSYKGISPEPAEITSSKGEKFHLNYVPALDYALASLASTGHSDDYQYDPQSGALSQSKGSYTIHDLQYLASGQLSEETIKISGGQTFSARHTYSMGGKLQEYTDVHGNKHEIHYDVFGRPQNLVQGKVKVSLVYDKASRVSKATVEDEEKEAKLTTSLTYDDFGREVKRSVQKGDATLAYDLTQTYNELGLVNKRLQVNGQGTLRDESFEYDVHNRLINYECQGSQPPVDNKGNALRKQCFTFDEYDNIAQCSTEFQDETINTAVYSFSAQEPTQLTQITNTHQDFPCTVEIKYDENGCLTQDEQGRKLEYNSMSRLTSVRDAGNKILAQYRYDATGRLVCQQVPDQPDKLLFYRGESLIAVKEGERKVSYLSTGSEYWGERASESRGGKTTTETNLWAVDSQQSVLATLDTQHPDQTHHQQYTPYCFFSPGPSSSSIGFNGQWRDPITGWYHLGNGYRVYNPVLMRFHTPDPWSPFTSGEINPYVYCLGDPINRVDPSGHFSIFGIEFGWRVLIISALTLFATVGAAVLTGGASLAVQVGVGIAVGAAAEVGAGLIADAALGNTITGTSVGLDAAVGLLGGFISPLGGQAMKVGYKAAAKGVGRALGRTGSMAVSKALPVAPSLTKALRVAARQWVPTRIFKPVLAKVVGLQQEEQAQAKSANAGNGGASSKPLGRLGPAQVGSPQFFLDRASSKARDIVRPAMKDGGAALAGAMFLSRDSTPMSSYGAETGLGQSGVAILLNRDNRFSFVAPSMNEQSEEQS